MADFGDCYAYTRGFDCSLPLPLFYGLASENPSLHIETLEGACLGNVEVMFRVFPSSLRDSALDWFLTCSSGSFHSWGELKMHFLEKFTPFYETHMLLHELSYFYQDDNESFSQCWERFKNVVFFWPSFNCELGSLLAIFCQGLNSEVCGFDLFTDEEFLDKNADDGWDYLDQLAQEPQLCEILQACEKTNPIEREDEVTEPPVIWDEPLPTVALDDQIPISLEEVSPPTAPSPLHDFIESPLCVQPFEKCSLVKEMDAEVDYLYALLEQQDACGPIFEGSPPPTPSPLHDCIFIEHIDFLGVDRVYASHDPYLLNLFNTWRINVDLNVHWVDFHFQSRAKQRRYSKYLIIWNGRVQYLCEGVCWYDPPILLALCGIADISIFPDGSLLHFFFSFF